MAIVHSNQQLASEKSDHHLMENKIGNIISNFRNLSSKIFAGVYDDFKRKVSGLDRQTDENVFQLLQARYLNELERKLREAAEMIVNENKNHLDTAMLRHELTNQISYLLSEFLQKAKSR